MKNFTTAEFRNPITNDDDPRLDTIDKILKQLPSVQVNRTMVKAIIGFMFGQCHADAITMLGWLYQESRVADGKTVGTIHVSDDPTRDKRVTLADMSGKSLSFQETLAGTVKVVYFMEQHVVSRTTRPRLVRMQGGKA